MIGTTNQPAPWRVDEPGEVGERAWQWLRLPALAEVLSAFFGPRLPESAAELKGLEQWSARTLDTRGGRERQEPSAFRLSPMQTAVVIDSADPLGLLRSPPPTSRRYDLTIVLGGTPTANRLRTALAKELADDGVVLGRLVGLATNRQPGDAELAAAGASYRGGVEWEDLEHSIDEMFGPIERTREQASDRTEGFDVWVERTGVARTSREVSIICAPSTRYGRRADTNDALRFLGTRMPETRVDNVLLVTSAIYVPYTFFVAAPLLRSLRANAIEVVGTRTEVVKRTELAQRLAQEIHSTIRQISEIVAIDHE
jgi:hypothetical protein